MGRLLALWQIRWPLICSVGLRNLWGLLLENVGIVWPPMTTLISTLKVISSATELIKCTISTVLHLKKNASNQELGLREYYTTAYGINRRSILYSLPYFSLFSCFIEDIMHAILDGTLPYTSKDMFKVFSLDKANSLCRKLTG